MTKFIEDGNAIKALYQGDTMIQGVVQSSRVKYGGKLQYTVILDTPVKFSWRNEFTDVVLVDADSVIFN